MPGSDKNRDEKKRQVLTNPAIALGTNLTSGMLFFSGIGYYMDHKRGGGVLWTLIGMFLGLAWCGYEVWKLISAQNRRDAKETARKESQK
jgi:F0F1-type ATP synthase assembly protein I